MRKGYDKKEEGEYKWLGSYGAGKAEDGRDDRERVRKNQKMEKREMREVWK